jgi:protein ImuB
MKRCATAEGLGVREGRTLAEARAVLGRREPFVRAFDPASDTAALRSLAVFAERFAPTVAVDPPDGLLLDVTGCEPLFGGEDRLAEAVESSVRRLGFSSRLAVAPTAGCAGALARFGDVPRQRVPEGGEHDALAPLPVSALRLSEATAGALQELGLHTIGHLFPLPRDEVWARFGAELLERLDRATGHASEPLIAVREEAPLHVERVFEGPVRDVAVVRTATRLLLERLCRELDAVRRGAMEVRLRVRRADGAVLDEPLAVSRATVDPRHLLTLLEPRLERMQMGDGIDELRLTASRTRRLRQVQASWVASGEGVPGDRPGGDRSPGDRSPGEDVSREMGRLVDTLTQRCGTKGVVVFAPVESHWPERAFAAGTPFATTRGRTAERRTAGLAEAVGAHVPSGDRPSLLLAQPEEAEVPLDERARPCAISWRGTTRRVNASVGPERIAVPWWEREAGGGLDAIERDYFRLVTEDGRWLWAFRCRNRWFVHGEWA